MKSQTLEQRIKEATDDVNNCLLEKINASKAEIDAQKRKTTARYALQKAKERLQGLENELME
jgi:ElaB/YqjD/DUF883 family membrane-anchored ribosome-binding protein